MTAPGLSIVIVTYNSRQDIGVCLRSIHDAAPPHLGEIVVVDNASADGTAALVRERWPEVRVIDAGQNQGFAAANNIGIRETSGDLLLLLNPDTEVRRGSIDALVGALEASPEAAAAGPRLVDVSGRAELSFGSTVSPFSELRQKILVRGHEWGLPLLAAAVERRTRRGQAVGWVSGACLLLRRRDAESVGLLDERYFMYLEDVDLCAALRARGRTILFVPDAEVVHARGRSRRSAASATEQAYRRSQIAFYEKHHPGWAPLLRTYLGLRGRLPRPRDASRS